MVAIWERQRSQAHSKLHLNSSITEGNTDNGANSWQFLHTGARISKNRLVTELLRLSKFQSEYLRPFISIFGVETQLFCTSCRYGCTVEHMCNCALQYWYLCFDFRHRRQSVRLTVANSSFGKPMYKRHRYQSQVS